MANASPKETNAATAAAQRIRELNAINEKVPKLLNSASTAISLLSATAPAQPSDSSRTGLEKRQDAFLAASREYTTLVADIAKELHSQVDALKEAGIIAGKGEEEGDGRHMSLGNLDVGWLNERTGDVGQGFEGELMAEARAVVEKLLDKKTESGDHAMSGT